ncbi:MAG: ABC transporter ATP-binding protein [Clostridia bacterium]
MITAVNLTKKFDDFTALKELNCNIPSGCIYGLVGSNGAGKSTFLRLVTGVYKPDGGDVYIDGTPIFENFDIKKKMVYVPDELYFLPSSNMKRMAKFYATMYDSFDNKRFEYLTNFFNLDSSKNINAFSKGMKRQAATILALSAKPDYIFFDETFDGLDPVMRNLVKKVIYSDVCERNATAVITSHSLRELEDTCDQLALLHEGGIVFESELADLKTSIFKVQTAFENEYDKELFNEIDIIDFSKKGKVSNIIVRGDKKEVVAKLNKLSPILLDVLPLTLEEVFIYEMESLGYAFPNLELGGENNE